MPRSLPILLCCTGLVLGGGAAFADDRGPVLVELYTSQGCSACPPADALIADLALRDDVLPLALHVDYWDYIGWEDQFAHAAHTDRQKAYAQAVGSRTIYTPQIIVDGTDQVVGTKPYQVLRLIDKHAETHSPVTLTLARDGATLGIEARLVDGVAPEAMVVQLVLYTPHERVEIEGGENAGHTLDYVNIVDDWRVLGEWDGTAPLDLKTEVEGPLAVIVQKAGPGEVLAVAQAD